MEKIFNEVLIVISLGILLPAYGQWDKHSIDENLNGAAGLYLGDIDGDTDLDLAATGYLANLVVWYENDGGNPINWTRNTIDNTLGSPHEIRVADIDGDLDMDIVTAGAITGNVVWYKNEGGIPITWTRYTIGNSLGLPAFVDVVNIDDDTDLDVIVTGYDKNYIVWFENGGGNPVTWIKHTIVNNLPGARHVRVIDIDDDTDLDVVAVAHIADVVVWYENDGGTWNIHTIDSSLNGAQQVRVADIDGDTDLDVVANADVANVVVWYENDGGIPITWNKHSIGGNLNGAGMDLTDIDGDKDLDVVSAGYGTNNVVWYENNSGIPITWIEHPIDANANGPRNLQIADVDDDGDPDVFVTEQGENAVVWYENSINPPVYIEDEILTPLDFKLLQNYPNPFNPSTTFTYSISTQSKVIIKIFDVLGNEIETLVNEEKSIGTYQLTWNAVNLPSGVYFYQLQTNNFIQAKKMILLK